MKFRSRMVRAVAFSVLLVFLAPIAGAGQNGRGCEREISRIYTKIIQLLRKFVPAITEDTITPPKPT